MPDGVEFPTCGTCGRQYQPDDIPPYCRGCGMPMRTEVLCPHCGKDINKPPEEIFETYYRDGGIPQTYPSPSPYSEWLPFYEFRASPVEPDEKIEEEMEQTIFDIFLRWLGVK